MTDDFQQNSAPPIWYKQFWPWFLIFFPATAVVAGIITIILAVQSDDGLVKDNYYKAGLAINQTLELKQKARELNLIANAKLDKLTQTITLKLSGKITELPPQLILQFAHATQSNHDQTATLLLAPDKKSYTGRIKKLARGNWNTILEPHNKTWQITGRAQFSEANSWTLDLK